MSTGLICVFDAKDGHLARTAWIYSLNRGDLRSGQVGWTVLGYQVEPNGDLLLATREEAAVLAPRKIQVAPLGISESMDNAAIERYLHQTSEALKAYPGVRWWRFDPDTGNLNSASAPEGAPDQIDSTLAMTHFHMRYRADGTMTFTRKPQPAP
jgi:hypothetical protein